MNIKLRTKALIHFLGKDLFSKESFIHPWDNSEMQQFARKLGISLRQLNDAVIDTGSLRTKDIKQYLRNKGQLFSFKKLWQQMNLNAFLY